MSFNRLFNLFLTMDNRNPNEDAIAEMEYAINKRVERIR